MSTPRNQSSRSESRPVATPSDRPAPAVPADSVPSDRDRVVERERQEFGGIKFGAAFFGWLAALGTAVLLVALLAATGAAIGLSLTGDLEEGADQALDNAEALSWIGAIALLVVLFVAYFCGGYVAGRMARFDGAKQGAAVWVWAVVIAIVVAILSAIGGAQFDILGQLNVFPRIPVDEGDLTLVGIITAIVLAIATLVAAVLGGMAGTRYHRRVDAAGLDH